MMRLRIVLVSFAWMAAVAMPATADMYKCRAADGRTLYTSDASQCPGAPKHEPRASVHTVDARPTRARSVRTPVLDADAAHAATWKRKKATAEAELTRLEGLLPRLESSVIWCNRGGDLYTEDEFGMRSTLSCSKVRDELDRASADHDRLRHYLESGGLEEECRRAGCLPGWIR